MRAWLMRPSQVKQKIHAANNKTGKNEELRHTDGSMCLRRPNQRVRAGLVTITQQLHNY